MSTKVLLRWFVASSLVVILLLLWVWTTPVRADCGVPQPSSCITCHAQADPVSGKGEWHRIHASKDICINCHGGNGSTLEKNLAHEGLVANPLNDIYTDCHSCHPQDYVGRANLFAATLGITPASCATSTPVPVSNIPVEPLSGGFNLPTNLVSTTSSLQSILVICVILSILTLFFFALGWLDRHNINS